MLRILFLLSLVPLQASLARADQAPLAYSTRPYEPIVGGRVAPSFPAEFSFSFKQHKWNENGFGVNHLSTGAWFSSLSAMAVRVDLVTLDWLSDNATVAGPIGPSFSSSLFDYSKSTNGTVPNSYYTTDPSAVAGTIGSCNTTNLPIAAAQGQLLTPDLLQTQGTYQGSVELPLWGQVDRWGVWFGDSILVVFYWANSRNADGSSTPIFVRYDEYSAGQQTTVITDVLDYRPTPEFAKNVFSPCK